DSTTFWRLTLWIRLDAQSNSPDTDESVRRARLLLAQPHLKSQTNPGDAVPTSRTLRGFRATIADFAVFGAVALLFATEPTASAEPLAQRGGYLVNPVAACGRCHTPRLAEGKPNPAMELAGGFEFDDPAIGHIVGPNLTPDRETGLGKWSEEEIVT